MSVLFGRQSVYTCGTCSEINKVILRVVQCHKEDIRWASSAGGTSRDDPRNWQFDCLLRIEKRLVGRIRRSISGRGRKSFKDSATGVFRKRK